MIHLNPVLNLISMLFDLFLGRTGEWKKELRLKFEVEKVSK
jgi:hypothetical protein